MLNKVKQILGSVRFWFVTIGATVAILAHLGVIDPEIQKIVLAWLGTVTGIGTVDSIATKIGGTQTDV
jgi:hypothetical protein